MIAGSTQRIAPACDSMNFWRLSSFGPFYEAIPWFRYPCGRVRTRSCLRSSPKNRASQFPKTRLKPF
jgi:hypothetical protein